MTFTRPALVVCAVATLVLVVLAILAFGAYSLPDFEGASILGLFSPMLAGMVPALVAIGLRSVQRARPWRLIVGGAIVAALFFLVPLYVGLKQQEANDAQLAFAATFLSWLGAAAGLAGALAAGIAIWIYGFIMNMLYGRRKAGLVAAIERELRASGAEVSVIELGPDAYDTLTGDWGDDAETLVVTRADGHVLGLASERWPIRASVPTTSLTIVRTGNGEHVHLR